MAPWPVVVRITISPMINKRQCIDCSNTQFGPSALQPSEGNCLSIIPVVVTNFGPDRPSKLPLSAFIVEDMTEFVQAHATYRFVILDEEEERPRMLVSANVVLISELR